MTESDYILFLLVVLRISGALLFNSILGRKCIPGMVQAGLAGAIAVGIMPTLPKGGAEIVWSGLILLTAMKELIIGIAMGSIINLVFSVTSVAGELSDMQLGLTMAKIYDPQTGTSTALSGTFFNLYMTLVFFLSDGHLTLIRLVSQSCELFPVGTITINPQAGGQIFLIFGDVLLIALKIAMPVLMIEILGEAGLGFIMRSVPSINMFAIGLQVKIALGLSITIIAFPVTSKIIDKALTFLFVSMKDNIDLMLSGG